MKGYRQMKDFEFIQFEIRAKDHNALMVKYGKIVSSLIQFDFDIAKFCLGLSRRFFNTHYSFGSMETMREMLKEKCLCYKRENSGTTYIKWTYCINRERTPDLLQFIIDNYPIKKYKIIKRSVLIPALLYEDYSYDYNEYYEHFKTPNDKFEMYKEMSMVYSD